MVHAQKALTDDVQILCDDSTLTWRLSPLCFGPVLWTLRAGKVVSKPNGESTKLRIDLNLA